MKTYISSCIKYSVIAWSLFALVFCGYSFTASIENDNDNGGRELDTWGSAHSFSYSSYDLAVIAMLGGVWQGQIYVYADDNVMGLNSFSNPPVLFSASSTHTSGTYADDITGGKATWGKTSTEFDSWLDFLSSSKNPYGP